LYVVFEYLDQHYDLIGAGVFHYISFRAALAAVVSLLIGLVFGENLIYILRTKQIGESIRDLGLEGQLSKKGTPTMGGIIIIASILIPTLLFAKINNIYIILLVVSTVWLGLIGFLDDYIKVFIKNKEGLHGRFKVVGQVGLGLIVGLTLYYNDNVVIGEYPTAETTVNKPIEDVRDYVEIKSTTTTVPFFKNNEFDYNNLVPFLPDEYTWVIYVLVVIFIITVVYPKNGTDS